MSAPSVNDLRGLASAVQAAGSKQACAELVQQLQQQNEAHNGEVSDLTRMTSKVQDLEFDLGNMRQSLQVLSSLLEAISKILRRSHVSLHTQSCCFLVLLQKYKL